MSAETLAEQVAKINAGDRVSARFMPDMGGAGEFVITGNAYTIIGSGVWLGDWDLQGGDVVKIIEHTPAKPAWHGAKVIKARLAGDWDVDTSDMPKFLLVQADEDVNGDWVSGRWNRYHHDDLTDVEVIVP